MFDHDFDNAGLKVFMVNRVCRPTCSDLDLRPLSLTLIDDFKWENVCHMRDKRGNHDGYYR
jgi:hypothetical protein